MNYEIRRIDRNTISSLDELIRESSAEGFAFVKRAFEEWTAGANRFSLPGESLFGAFDSDACIGLCGLNIDPFTDSLRTGRLRRYYVSAGFRRTGIGRNLLKRVVSEAAVHFDVIRVYTDNPEAAEFYEANGFRRSETEHQSHVMMCGKPDEDSVVILHTDGGNPDFIELCGLLDDNLDEIVGGAIQRSKYTAFNTLDRIKNAAVLYCGRKAAAGGALRPYEDDTIEIKRVFVRKEFRRRGLALRLMKELELKAVEMGYRRLILETGLPLKASMALYRKIGFRRISNYGPYADMPESVCMEKLIEPGNKAL